MVMHIYIYIYMYSRFRIYFLDILNDSLNAFSYRFNYIYSGCLLLSTFVAVYKKTTCMYIVILDLELYIHFYQLLFTDLDILNYKLQLLFIYMGFFFYISSIIIHFSQFLFTNSMLAALVIRQHFLYLKVDIIKR